ncbi:MAG: peroxiredoxin [Lautropia sp.]|nr:peroxiredoxin [Lautropia sp.]
MESSPSPASAPLQTGQTVPDIPLETTGGPMRLSDLRGRLLVLYFYPKDNTPGCSNEAADFAEHWQAFRDAGAEVLGVSRDSLHSHQLFHQKFDLPFVLVSDPDEILCTRFGVIRMKNMYGRQVRGIERSTFLIGRDGVLLQAWRKVKVPGHTAAVLDAVRSAARPAS